MSSQRPTEADITGVLTGVIDPELGSNIVDLGMVKAAKIDDDGRVEVHISLTTSGCPLRAQIQRDTKSRIESMPGVTKLRIVWGELNKEEKAATMAVARKNASAESNATTIPATTRVLAISSGKGGVGKSSVTANLAAAVALAGYKVGVIDADIWGFSLPRMFGLEGRVEAKEQAEGERPAIVPRRLDIKPGFVDVVSMGFLVDDESSALLWRGLMLNRAVQHFLEDVAWDPDLDYIFIDMPPGTGDVAMGLARMLPRAEMIVVTTPATGAQKVASRAVSMARKTFMRVAGVIENMSVYVSEDGQSHDIFGSGGGEKLARESGVELLGDIPIERAVSTGGDTGQPVVLAPGDSPAKTAFVDLAQLLVTEVAPPVENASCTARLFEAVDAALDAHDAST